VKGITPRYWPHMLGDNLDLLKTVEDRMKVERYMLGRIIMQIMIDALITKY
jgi:hypothetical protein